MLHFLAALASPRQGFVGVYNAAVGVVADGHNTSAYDVGAWSPNAVENSPTQGSHAASLSLADNIQLLCRAKDANQLYGMLIAASEGGGHRLTQRHVMRRVLDDRVRAVQLAPLADKAARRDRLERERASAVAVDEARERGLVRDEEDGGVVRDGAGGAAAH